MKTSTKLVIASFCAACAWSATGQVASLPSRQVAPSENNSDVVPDGISFYHGQTFLLLNGRAARITSALVPEGKVLTRAGRLVPLPPELSRGQVARAQISPSAASDAVQDGIVHVRGQSYLVKGLSLVPINGSVIPEGQVLSAANTLTPLPSDFSGFNRERTPAGLSTLPTRNDNNQVLSRQAGVPQIAARATPVPTQVATPPPKVVATTGAVRKGSATQATAATMRGTTLSSSTPQRKYVPMTIQDGPPAPPEASLPLQMPMRNDYRGESSNPLLPLPPIGTEIPPNLPSPTGNQ